MGLTTFKLYQELLKKAHYKPDKMGFKCEAGDINEFANRVRLVRSFRGLHLEGYRDDTVAGYNAFLLIFLTHSALERFREIFGVESDTGLSPMLLPYQPKTVADEFVAGDPKRLLFDFMYERLDNKRLREHLSRIYDGDEDNIAHLSASIRHIFAHGHLTAHAHGINPRKVNNSCARLSNFIIDFMDAEFTKTVKEYQLLFESRDTI